MAILAGLVEFVGSADVTLRKLILPVGDGADVAVGRIAGVVDVGGRPVALDVVVRVRRYVNEDTAAIGRTLSSTVRLSPGRPIPPIEVDRHRHVDCTARVGETESD